MSLTESNLVKNMANRRNNPDEYKFGRSNSVKVKKGKGKKNNQNHRVVRRRIIRRVPFILVFWAFLFHSEKLHPILHKSSTSANTAAWFSQSQYSMMGVYAMGDDGRDSFSGGSSMGYGEEEEKRTNIFA